MLFLLSITLLYFTLLTCILTTLLFCRDYIDFLEDLEEDPQYRTNVNIYRDEAKMVTSASSPNDDDDEDLPQVSLEEMLQDLNIGAQTTAAAVLEEGGDVMME